ncbi:MAG: hypothetical protein JWO40_665 [Candidatus Doudnabacteria bacterium]|nr:hypothetical protein [Candidatus Doudnabacteria bacterium]
MLKSINKRAVAVAMLASALTLAFAGTTLAADLRFNNNNNSALEIGSNESVTNLYTAGSQVIVKAKTAKDLVIAGANLDIDGTVGDDLLAAGGTVNVKGDVSGSARIIGGNIHIDSKVIGQDLVVAGGTVYVSSDTIIYGDLLVAGGNVYVDGAVRGNIKATAGTISLNGAVDGNVDAKTNKGLVLGSSANIKGNVNYTSAYVYQRDANAKVGGAVNYTIKENHRNYALTLLTFGFLVKLAGELLAALLLLWIFKDHFRNAVRKVGYGFWHNVGIGALTLILVPIVAGIFFVTIIGWYVGVALLLMYVLMLMFAWLASAAYFGSWLVSKLDKKEMRVDWLTVIIGIILAALLTTIPLIGFLFGIVLALAGLGIFFRHYRKTA